MITCTACSYQDDELLDKREFCFCIQSSSGDSRYLGVGELLLLLIKQYYRCTHRLRVKSCSKIQWNTTCNHLVNTVTSLLRPHVVAQRNAQSFSYLKTLLMWPPHSCYQQPPDLLESPTAIQIFFSNFPCLFGQSGCLMRYKSQQMGKQWNSLIAFMIHI